MSDTHLQVNPDGSIAERKTVLWPTNRNDQEAILKGLFSRDNWEVTSIQNINGSHWKVITECSEKTYKINLYISSIRDEDRQQDEFKMQLGTYYPSQIEPDWITLVLGIYTIDDGDTPQQFLLSGYDWKRYNFSGNPSIRGTRTSGLQKAKLFGMFKSENSILFRPEFIYYYIEYSGFLFGVDKDGENGARKGETDNSSLQQIFYGAPGTGKSNTIKRRVDDQKKTNFRVTFHPDSDYSTFVGCYKPTTVKSGERAAQPILDYDSLVDKFKEYLTVPNVNITKACTLFGFDYHDSIVRIQEQGLKVMDLVNDAYKSNTSYDSVVRGGMACYEQTRNVDGGSKITYEFVPQAFTKAYTTAWNTEDEVYLIIEEINRGNCAQIFGDLFQLLDRKDGFSEYPVDADSDLAEHIRKELLNSPRTDFKEGVKEGKKLMLPPNLYIWATMNTSDQSLFPIDSAFKRRWDWKYMKIAKGKDKDGNDLDWQIVVKDKDGNNVKINDKESLLWWDFISRINEIIASMTSSADKQLGYFFCKAKNGIIDEETFVSKVIFYLWNDVFKDYGFEDPNLFKYKDDKGETRDLTFPDFYDEEGKQVNTVRLKDFIENVMNWKKEKEEQK